MLLEAVAALRAPAPAPGTDIEPHKPGAMRLVPFGLLHALWCYGSLNPVEGVIYERGGHRAVLNEVQRYFAAQSNHTGKEPEPSTLAVDTTSSSSASRRGAPAPALPQAGVNEEEIADAIDAARYAPPYHPRGRERPFAEALSGDREYALRLARAAIARLTPVPAVPEGRRRFVAEELRKYATARTQFEDGMIIASQAILAEASTMLAATPAPAVEGLENNDAGSEPQSPSPVERRE